MRNRDYKKFSSDAFFHIYNRGNNKEKIFFDEQDYRAFLFRTALALGFEQKELTHPLISMPQSRIRITNTNKNDFKLHSFCLMPNHFHLLIEQISDTSISKLILKICTSYAKYINQKHKRVGHLFQDQFKSVLIENNPQIMWTSSYIHMNPVKDGIASHPSEYEWGSYNDYLIERGLPITHTEFIISLFGTKENFIKETVILSDVKGAL